MLCDILIASPTAVFGQPEITLGIIPGMGGSQRLTSLIGKARAMDMVLTGRKIDAETAERWGLVSRVTKEGESVTEEAVKVAESVSKFGKVAVQAGKEAVNGCKCDAHIRDIYLQTVRSDTEILCSSRSSPRARSQARKEVVPATLRD